VTPIVQNADIVVLLDPRFAVLTEDAPDHIRSLERQVRRPVLVFFAAVRTDVGHPPLRLLPRPAQSGPAKHAFSSPAVGPGPGRNESARGHRSAPSRYNSPMDVSH